MDETPTKLFLETSLPTSASPYPSPSSAFYPPPIPASHEFANKLGTGLAGNKRYRGSGGAAAASSSTRSGRSASPPVNNGNTLSPSSANSSRRGSASAPSPLSTNRPLVNPVNGLSSSNEPSTTESEPSHDRITTGEETTNIAPAPAPAPLPCNLPPNPAYTDSLSASTPSTIPNPTPSTPPLPPPPLTSTTNPSITPAAPASKRASQILESLTPIRAAPPSPGPSRRGSLIRRGSSRRWSRSSGAPGATSGSTTTDSIGVPGGGMGGMAGIGSTIPWLIGSGEANGGTTSSTVSEDGSLHSSEDPTSSTTTTATSAAASAAAAASKRASRRLSAFQALASTTEGEIISFSDKSPLSSKEGAAPPPPPDSSSPKAAPPPAEIPTETEPPTPSADMETPTEIVTESTSPAAGGSPEPPGTTALKPILVADFGFSMEDPRHTKRPFELLTRFERDALSPEERAGYGRRKEKEEEEWEENAEEEWEEEDRWGWVGVSGLRPRRRGGAGGGGGGVDDEGEDEQEMTPRFGYGYSHPTTTTTTNNDSSTPTAPNLHTGNKNNNANGNDNANASGGGGGGGEGGGDGENNELDPDDSPLPPGIYRALYAFEAEGTAEMTLEEGQLVRVVGRGGGVGWAVVERGWRPENSGSALPGGGGGGEVGSPDAAGNETPGALGMAGQALVPEGYLEVWMLDGDDWGGVGDVDDF